jgi:hypothetical protein
MQQHNINTYLHNNNTQNVNMDYNLMLNNQMIIHNNNINTNNTPTNSKNIINNMNFNNNNNIKSGNPAIKIPGQSLDIPDRMYNINNMYQYGSKGIDNAFSDYMH